MFIEIQEIVHSNYNYPLNKHDVKLNLQFLTMVWWYILSNFVLRARNTKINITRIWKQKYRKFVLYDEILKVLK